jgi:hypothetical protein
VAQAVRHVAGGRRSASEASGGRERAAEHQVPVHDHAQRPAGAHGEGRLHVELALDQALAGAWSVQSTRGARG